MNPFDQDPKTIPIRNDGERCIYCKKKTSELKLLTSTTRYCPDCENKSTKQAVDPYGFQLLPSRPPKPAFDITPPDDFENMTFDDWIAQMGDDIDPFIKFMLAINPNTLKVDFKHYKKYLMLNTNLLENSNKTCDNSLCDIHEAYFCPCKQNNNIKEI